MARRARFYAALRYFFGMPAPCGLSKPRTFPQTSTFLLRSYLHAWFISGGSCYTAWRVHATSVPCEQFGILPNAQQPTIPRAAPATLRQRHRACLYPVACTCTNDNSGAQHVSTPSCRGSVACLFFAHFPGDTGRLRAGARLPSFAAAVLALPTYHPPAYHCYFRARFLPGWPALFGGRAHAFTHTVLRHALVVFSLLCAGMITGAVALPPHYLALRTLYITENDPYLFYLVLFQFVNIVAFA